MFAGGNLAGGRFLFLAAALLLAGAGLARGDETRGTGEVAHRIADDLVGQARRHLVDGLRGRKTGPLNVSAFPEVARLRDLGVAALPALRRMLSRRVMEEGDLVGLAVQLGRRATDADLRRRWHHHTNAVNTVATRLLGLLGEDALPALAAVERRLATAMNDGVWIRASGPLPAGSSTEMVAVLVETLGLMGPHAAPIAPRVTKILEALNAVREEQSKTPKVPKTHQKRVAAFRSSVVRSLSQMGAGAIEEAMPALLPVLLAGSKQEKATARAALVDSGALPVAFLMVRLDAATTTKERKYLERLIRDYTEDRLCADHDAPEDILWETSADLGEAADVIFADVRTEIRRGHGSPVFRGMLARILGYAETRGHTAASLLTELMDDESEDVRAGALEGLAQLGKKSRKAIPKLLDALATGSTGLRTRAVEALGATAGNAAVVVPALTRALSDPEADVRAGAAVGLRSYTASAVGAIPALEKLALDENRDVRRAAVETLAHLRGRRR